MVNTFLPYESFARSAEVIDPVRLGNQIKESHQIMLALIERRGWIHHPATKMWAGSEQWLFVYATACQQELLRRNAQRQVPGCPPLKLHASFYELQALINEAGLSQKLLQPYPAWLGDDRFHASHRSNLMRKNRDHFIVCFGDIADDLPYFWPTKEGY